MFFPENRHLSEVYRARNAKKYLRVIAKAYLVAGVQNYARGTKEVKFSLFQARIILPLQERHRPCSRSRGGRRGTSFFRSLHGCRSTKNFSNNNEQDTILTQAINYTIPLLHFYAPQSSGRGWPADCATRAMCARERETLIIMH